MWLGFHGLLRFLEVPACPSGVTGFLRMEEETFTAKTM